MSPSSTQACAGRLSNISAAAVTNELTTIQMDRKGRAHGEQRANATRRAALRWARRAAAPSAVVLRATS